MKNPDLQLTTAATGGKTHAKNGTDQQPKQEGKPSGKKNPTYQAYEMLTHNECP